MAETSEIYRSRAALERANAEAAALDNVRERCERAAHAWDVMADRLDRTTALRTEREDAAAAAEERRLMPAGATQ